MYELTQSQAEQDFQLPILNLFEFCLNIGEHFTQQIDLTEQFKKGLLQKMFV